MSRIAIPNQTKVFLVGAGPGDPRLMTLRGIECLRNADVVFHDCLVNREILEAHSRADVPRFAVCRDSKGQPGRVSQREVAAELVGYANRGETVVYLKGGDPAIFGHMDAEVEALSAVGLSFEVVPGVTAASAAACCAEIPITHGRHCSAVALVSAQQQRDAGADALDIGRLGAFPGVLAFYMGEESASQWSRRLIDAGRSPETPIAIVRRGTWPDQAVYRGTLGSLVEVIEEQSVQAPTVIFVGDVVGLSPARSWFEERPLFGQTVLVTRPREQIAPLKQRLENLGARVLVQPAIEISPPVEWQSVDETLDRLDKYDWIVFSSANGVQSLFDRLLIRHGDIRRLGEAKLAAIGPATADALASYRVRADVIPPQFRAESLADALRGEAAGCRFLLARASRGREILAESLEAAGGRVEQVVVYQSTDVTEPNTAVIEALDNGQVDWITMTSSAIARSTAALLGDRLRGVKLASISPITSETLRSVRLEPTVEATEYTMDGIVTAILQASLSDR